MALSLTSRAHGSERLRLDHANDLDRVRWRVLAISVRSELIAPHTFSLDPDIDPAQYCMNVLQTAAHHQTATQEVSMPCRRLRLDRLLKPCPFEDGLEGQYSPASSKPQLRSLTHPSIAAHDHDAARTAANIACLHRHFFIQAWLSSKTTTTTAYPSYPDQDSLHPQWITSPSRTPSRRPSRSMHRLKSFSLSDEDTTQATSPQAHRRQTATPAAVVVPLVKPSR